MARRTKRCDQERQLLEALLRSARLHGDLEASRQTSAVDVDLGSAEGSLLELVALAEEGRVVHLCREGEPVARLESHTPVVQALRSLRRQRPSRPSAGGEP
jgi:antitoxin (DNA-binding transcriptional repressor) of toxin-antitoxin stability system